ncbi:MAG: integral rane sensor signal transduction histidine kinase, partial [Bacteroidota bacterium]|nr:integral rane sensor signal transduction histidine kinase [Bacteroidota bacterium]
ISPSGKKIEGLSSVKLVVNADSLPGWVAIYTDITPLKLNEELKEALRKLEVNNEYMEQLAYISAHDIKSPIIALEGLTNMLHNSNAIKPEYAEVLKMMKNTINQMQRTNHSLNNILKLRKNLLRKEDVSDQSMALGTIVADAQATVQSNLDEINAKVIVELAGVAEVPLPYVHIKSIFLNLLTNAIKYCDPERPLRISITAEKQDDIISFTVQDNGLGIDMDLNKDRIFGIFKRFHDHVEGSGVGLHIVKSIVDAYGGTITVDSTEGVGTSFKISFNTAIIV